MRYDCINNQAEKRNFQDQTKPKNFGRNFLAESCCLNAWERWFSSVIDFEKLLANWKILENLGFYESSGHYESGIVVNSSVELSSANWAESNWKTIRLWLSYQRLFSKN